MDAVGQSGGRTYEEMQRNPGDWDVMVSQRPIAVHTLEHPGTTDQGVMLLRRLLRMAARGEYSASLPLRDSVGPVNTQTHDTVLKVRTPSSADERNFLRDLGERVTAAIVSGEGLAGQSRINHVRERIAALPCDRPDAA